jgi:Phage integrase family
MLWPLRRGVWRRACNVLLPSCEVPKVSTWHSSNIFQFSHPENAAISDLFRNEDEFERLVLVVPPHLKPIIQIAVLTGMRLEELLSLEWPQIDLSRHEIRVENPKNDRPRIVPVADGAVLRLAPPGFTRCPLPRALNPDSPVAARASGFDSAQGILQSAY